MSDVPYTINFHINYLCNAKCNYCYRPQADELSHEAQCAIVDAIAGWGSSSPNPLRINFAGGEPTLVKHLSDLICRAKQAGLGTSIITNGTYFAKVGLGEFVHWLDMVGISIDSLDSDTNRAIGRPHIELASWKRVAEEARRKGVRLKINTVVTRQNCHENLTPLIAAVRPDRWKILRAIEIEGVNSQTSGSWRTNDTEFAAFVERHSDTDIPPIVEDDDDLRGSYAMITPDGRFYDSIEGGYRKSSPILDVGIEAAFGEVHFSHSKFEKRGGRYSVEDMRQ